MPEYIEREAVLKELNKNSITKAITFADGVSIFDTIKNFPTADAVEVVRCKDCEFCYIRYPRKEIGKEPEIAYYCETFRADKDPNDFCSHGKRKEGAE